MFVFRIILIQCKYHGDEDIKTIGLLETQTNGL